MKHVRATNVTSFLKRWEEKRKQNNTSSPKLNIQNTPSVKRYVVKRFYTLPSTSSSQETRCDNVFFLNMALICVPTGFNTFLPNILNFPLSNPSVGRNGSGMSACLNV